MRLLAVACVALSLADGAGVQAWMQQAFYPVLLTLLLLASLGVPLPEDIPLIAAGILLRTHAGVASWPGTLVVALVGVMLGDLVLYRLGRMWGPDVVRHRTVARVVTPRRFERAAAQFHRHGVWFCFLGRFLMGVRSVMCLVAGATHYPWWRFFLADLMGAVLSVPAFLYLGYWSAGLIPHLRRYIVGAEWTLALVVAVPVVLALYYRRRRRRRRRRALETARNRPRRVGDATAGPPLPAGEAARAEVKPETATKPPDSSVTAESER